MLLSRTLVTTISSLAISACTLAQVPGPTAPGPGNARAAAIATNSPLVQSAYTFIQAQIGRLADPNLRAQTQDAILNANTCILHRANLKPADQQVIVAQLLAQGLLNPADNAMFPGGLLAGVFPPVVSDGTACPHLPQPFTAAPGSGNGSHHSYPGGLSVHESNNEVADINLASEYRNVYGEFPPGGLPSVNTQAIAAPQPQQVTALLPFLDGDLIIGAPFGTTGPRPSSSNGMRTARSSPELSIGGSGAALDNYGQAGDARTGGHHILSIAEAMKRSFSPAFIITQASAHSAPTLGNEYKVVNWIRAAAIVAQQDPIARGYLVRDVHGNLRLPALRETNQVDLNAAGQTNILTEYQLHNLSDADFTQSIPAVTSLQVILAQLAPSFGFNPADVSTYNNNFRNVVFANFSAERLYAVYTADGLDGIRFEVQLLRNRGAL